MEKPAVKESMSEPLLQQTHMSMTDRNQLKLDALTNTQVYAYGVGHFLNDAVAGLILNYALYYLVEIRPVDDTGKAASIVGLVFLVGQITDGLATPVVGIFSDKFNTSCGKRMPWYYFGMFLVSIPTILFFQPCYLCMIFEKTIFISFFNYALLCAVINIGWAMCQVSHMSLVPSLSLSRARRDMLNNLRGMFSFIANLVVLVLAFGLFQIIENERLRYEVLCQVSIGLSFLTSIFFVYQIREKPLTRACRKLAKEYKLHYSKLSNVSIPDSVLNDDSSLSFKLGSRDSSDQASLLVRDTPTETENEENRNERSSTVTTQNNDFRWYHWFRSTEFWIYGIVYMCARIYNTIPTGLMLFYLNYALDFHAGVPKEMTPLAFALVPMVIFLSSSLTAGQLIKLYKTLGRKKVFLVATVLSSGIAAGELLLPSENRIFFYIIAVVLGIVQSALLNTSIAYISEVVGINGEKGAFVYGFYSLFEKMANGILLWLILELKEVNNRESENYLRICISVIPFASAILGLICVLIGKAADYQSGENSDALVGAH